MTRHLSTSTNRTAAAISLPDGYRVVRRLGVGGMAEVFLVAPTTGAGPPVVLKRLLPQAPAEVQKLFAREAEALAALSNPHVVGFVGAGPDYLLVDYIDGCTLTEVVTALRRDGARLESAALRLLLADLLTGLEALHDAGLIHRDLNPRNIMIDRAGRARIIDLGIVKRPYLSESTVDGIKGTLAYMAPEQLRGEAVDARTDLYAMGLIAYELVCGVSLTPTTASLSDLVALRTRVPLAPSLMGQQPPADASDYDGPLLRALSPQPQQRFASAAAMRAALPLGPQTDEAIAAARGVLAGWVARAVPSLPAVGPSLTLDKTQLASTDSAAQTVTTSPARTRLLVVTLAFGLLGGGALMGWLLGQSDETPQQRQQSRRSRWGRPAGGGQRVAITIEAAQPDQTWTVASGGSRGGTPWTLRWLRGGTANLRLSNGNGDKRGVLRLRARDERVVLVARQGADCGPARQLLEEGQAVRCRIDGVDGVIIRRGPVPDRPDRPERAERGAPSGPF